jgi:small-conductance mechanosensitive channel
MIDFSLSLVLQVVAIIGLALLIGYFLSWALTRVARRAGVSRAQLITIRKWINVLMLALAVTCIVNVVGLGSQFELLTLSGAGVLIVTLALQGFVSSMLAGFLVFSADTLRLGDIVEVSGAGKGRVVQVGLRNVWIKTEKGALVTIENTRLEHGRFWNYSAAERLKKKFDSKTTLPSPRLLKRLLSSGSDRSDGAPLLEKEDEE